LSTLRKENQNNSLTIRSASHNLGGDMNKNTSKYTRLLRRLRQRIFDYPPHQALKAERVLLAVKERAMMEPENVEARNRAQQAISERMLRMWA
jgi:hypothetical protein